MPWVPYTSSQKMQWRLLSMGGAGEVGGDDIVSPSEQV